MSLKIRPLTKELQKIAEVELNEDPSRIEEYLQHLKDWITKQPHLNARQDDYFLLCFLRCCKFSLQRAKEKLDYFHSLKTLWPEYYVNRDPMSNEMQEVLKVGAMLPLPKPIGEFGPRIILARWSVCNPATVRYQTVIKLAYMMIDILMQEDDNAVVSGIYLLIDFENFDPSYAIQFTPNAMHRSATILQSAYPLRTKGFDFINVSPLVDGLFNIVRTIFTPKLKERAHSYTKSAIANVYKHIPKEILPIEYGGSAESVKDIAARWKVKTESYAEWFKEDMQYCTNEALRPEESKGEMFGVDGTFKKLNLD